MDYTPGVTIAVAKDVESARKQLLERSRYLPEADLMQEPAEIDMTKPWALALYGGG